MLCPHTCSTPACTSPPAFSYTFPAPTPQLAPWPSPVQAAQARLHTCLPSVMTLSAYRCSVLAFASVVLIRSFSNNCVTIVLQAESAPRLAHRRGNAVEQQWIDAFVCTHFIMLTLCCHFLFSRFQSPNRTRTRAIVESQFDLTAASVLGYETNPEIQSACPSALLATRPGLSRKNGFRHDGACPCCITKESR